MQQHSMRTARGLLFRQNRLTVLKDKQLYPSGKAHVHRLLASARGDCLVLVDIHWSVVLFVPRDFCQPFSVCYHQCCARPVLFLLFVDVTCHATSLRQMNHPLQEGTGISIRDTCTCEISSKSMCSTVTRAAALHDIATGRATRCNPAKPLSVNT